MQNESIKVLFGMADWEGNGRLVRQLREREWEVIRVERAARVIEAANREPPHVIIIDAGIQGGGAAVALAALAHHPVLGRVPTIVIDLEDDIPSQHWLTRGASLSLPRKARPDDVLDEIEAFLGLARPKPPEPELRLLGEEERFHDALGSRVLTLHEDDLLSMLAHLAARLLKVPGVMLVPLEESLQFFTSQRGYRDPEARAKMPDVPFSFPRWLVSSGISLSVADVEEDPAFAGSPTLSESRLRAWSAFPVLGWDDKPFAVVFAADSRAHQWTPRDHEMLEDIGGMLAAYTAHARLGYYRDEGKVPAHRLNAHALQSWGAGIKSVGDTFWHADFRLSKVERQRLAEYVQMLGKQVASSSGRWS